VTIRKRGIPKACTKERIIALFLAFIDRHFWREIPRNYCVFYWTPHTRNWTVIQTRYYGIAGQPVFSLPLDHAESLGEQCSVFYMI
jgi:hypothetical protein